jgi:hypothetical protein
MKLKMDKKEKRKKERKKKVKKDIMKMKILIFNKNLKKKKMRELSI